MSASYYAHSYRAQVAYSDRLALGLLQDAAINLKILLNSLKLSQTLT